MNEEILQANSIIKKRYIVNRIADHLPKWARVIFYILLVITLVFIIYQVIKWLLIGLQKIGYFFFSPNHYWVFISCVFITFIGTLLLAQYVWGQNPFGNFANWVTNNIKAFRHWLGALISG